MLKYVAQQMNIYVGLFICITGFIGGLLSIIVFTTLKTFRETTCGTYLTAVSVTNLAQSLTVLFPILNNGFGYALVSSPIYCRFRFSISQYLGLFSFTNMCMATIDQFLSMSKYRHLNSIRLARYHIISAGIACFLHAMLSFIFYDSNGYACVITNNIFAKYYTYFYLPVLLGFLPVTITGLFSLMAFIKIYTNTNREMAIARVSRDRQLTTMTLTHALLIFLTITPYIISFIYMLSVTPKTAEEAALNQLVYVTTGLWSFVGHAVSLFNELFIDVFSVDLVSILHLLLCIKTLSATSLLCSFSSSSQSMSISSSSAPQ